MSRSPDLVRRTLSAPSIDNYLEHFHGERPHQGKGNIILFPQIAGDANPTRAGPVLCNRRLGGLLKFYYREAA